MTSHRSATRPATAAPARPGDLTSTLYGADRAGGYVVAVARTTADHSTLWAATATGRVFISQNANAPSLLR